MSNIVRSSKGERDPPGPTRVDLNCEREKQLGHPGAGLDTDHLGLGIVPHCLTQVIGDALLNTNNFTEHPCQTECSVTHESRQKQDRSVIVSEYKTGTFPDHKNNYASPVSAPTVTTAALPLKSFAWLRSAFSVEKIYEDPNHIITPTA